MKDYRASAILSIRPHTFYPLTTLSNGASLTNSPIKKIRILQVGDIHFPWAKSQKPAADFGSGPEKLPGITENLTAPGIALNKLSSSIRKICEEKPDFIVFVGDYTNKGDRSGHESAIDYCLDGLLKPILDQSEIQDRCIFVPGNHDVTRPKNPGSDPLEKFHQYKAVMEGRRLTNHSAVGFSKVHTTVFGKTLAAVGINTCMGCGEFRSMPGSISSAIQGATASETPDELYEQLDMPFLDRLDIDGLDLELSTSPTSRTPIVVGHHNLLPQRETRVLPYGELINSGILREILTTKDYPVLYLHGHIHSDPVELIHDPSFPEGGVLSISAPLITQGLNVIDLYLDDTLDILGVDLIPWRFSATLQLSRLRSLRIPLINGRNKLARLPETSRKIFKHLVDAGDSAQRHLTQISRELAIELAETASGCEALAWAGLIHLDHAHKSHEKWDVRIAI